MYASTTRVFLCHASQDKPTVWKLYRYLKQHKVQPWLDQEDLLPGQNWEAEIPKALFASDAILVCLSKNSVNKEGFVQKEITFALDKALEKPVGTIFIIPVKLEECEIPERLSRYQWVDLSRPEGRKRLLMGLNKRVNDLGSEVQQISLDDTRTRTTPAKPPTSQKSAIQDDDGDNLSPEPEINRPEPQTVSDRGKTKKDDFTGLSSSSLDENHRKSDKKPFTKSTPASLLARETMDIQNSPKDNGLPSSDVSKREDKPRSKRNLRPLGIGGSIVIGLLCLVLGGIYFINNWPTPSASPTLSPTPPGTGLLVGEVSDFGGVDDKSFNQMAWEGVKKANDELGTDGKFLESKVQSDYAKNVQQFVSEGSNLVVTVGFNMGIDTATAAKANPDTLFAIVDYTYPDCFSDTAVEGKDCGSKAEMPNVRGLAFQTDEAAMLAGYAAAGMTKTGKVATFGGLPFPTVTIFMQGFEAGVKYYNEKNGTDVQLLGWDSAKNEGTFVNNFDSTDDGRKTAESFMQEGADIILPVAGPVGFGSAAVCKETGKCMIIGVDADWYLTAPEYKEVMLTSVLKRVDVAVYSSIKDAIDGNFKGGNVTYALKDGGVDIAPFHDFDSQVSADLKAQLDQLRKDIISGTVTVKAVLGIQ